MITRQDDSWSSETPGRDAGVRVVLVGTSELERPLRRVPGMELIRSREPMAALGEVSNPIDADSPARTVVLVSPGAVATDRAENFASGVRRIDATARVLNIGTYALRGFDAALPESIEELAPIDLLSRLTGIEHSRKPESADTVDIDADPVTITQEVPAISDAAAPAEERDDAPADDELHAGVHENGQDQDAPAEATDDVHEPAPAPEALDEPPAERARDQQDAQVIGLAPESEERVPPSTHYSAFEATEGLAAATAEHVPNPPAEPENVPVVTAGPVEPTAAPATHVAAPTSAPRGPNDAERVVQALLHGQDPIEAVMGPVRERLGVPNAAFVPIREGEDVPPPTGGVPVRFGDRTLGHLVAPRVPREEVEAEAAQLAGWIALSTQHQQLKAAAFADELTGAWNRRYFARFLGAALEKGRSLRRPVTLLYFDIDDFKVYNDKYGHAAGDEILVEVVKLLRSVIRPTDRVCRVGGDEFVVVFFDPDGPRDRSKEQAPDDIMPIARRFQQQICEHRFPKLAEEARGTLTISGGMASFPWDGHDVQTLLDRADELALKSKSAGKNAITLGPGAEMVCRGV